MQKIEQYQGPEGLSIRAIVGDDGEPWFVARDVCESVGLKPDSNLFGHLDDDEKGTNSIRTPGGLQEITTVSEPGLYKLMMRSRKPGAKAFARWVTHEVLPSIRKTGAYAKTDVVADQSAMLKSLVLELVPAIAQAVMVQVDAKLAQTPVAAGAFKSRRSAVSGLQMRVRTAIGWSGAGARLDRMPVSILPYAEREVAAVEREFSRFEPKSASQDSRLPLQLSIN